MTARYLTAAEDERNHRWPSWEATCDAWGCTERDRLTYREGSFWCLMHR
jgi:hypothetical protein